MKALDYTALTIAIIGAVNWGLVGIFRFDLIAALFGNMSWFSRLVYILVGLSGLYLLSLYGRIRNESKKHSVTETQTESQGALTGAL